MLFLLNTIKLFVCGILLVLQPHHPKQDGATLPPQKVSADTSKVQALLHRSEKLANSGQYGQAKKLIGRAESLADSLDYETGLQGAYSSRANILLSQYKADSARVLLEKAIHRFPDGAMLDDLYNMLGAAYRYEGKNKKAIRTFKTAISLFDSTKYAGKLGHIKLNMADVYYNMGSKGRAFQYYHQALNLAEQAQDSTFLAVVLNNLGDTYDNEKDYKKADYYLQQSIDLSRKIGFKVNEFRSLTNLANTKKDAGKLDEALSYYQKALTLSAEIRPDSPPMIIYYNLGTLYGDKKDFNKAENYFKKSLNYSKQGGIGPGLYHNSMGLGHLAVLQDHTSEAITWYSQALKHARELHSISFEKAAHEQLYQLYKQRNNNGQALAHLESLKTITDSLNQKRYKQKLAEYQTKLEVGRQTQINKVLSAKQEKQQALLSKQYWLIAAAIIIISLLGIIAYVQYRLQKNKQKAIRLLQEKQDELKELNQEKNRLFAIVAHDIRNPLSAMQGMLYLLRNDELSENEMQELLTQLEISMSQNMKVMGNLLAWAQQQLSGLNIALSSLNMKELVDAQLGDHYFEAEQKGIYLSEKVPAHLEAYADFDLVNLIFRNLIGNAIKFCSQGDNISIDGHRKNGHVQIKVSDTGIGIPARQQRAIFSDDVTSRLGTNKEKGSGLGLSLCREFIELQGGELSLKSQEGQGSSFTFTLPASD